MKVPVSWLREYVAFELPLSRVLERLATSTLEVERVSHRGVPDGDGNLARFLVGHVLEAGKHPNADRLQLCRVDVGEPEPRQIVCGAWNFSAGATVAVALPGAVLPGGQKLERTKLRGETSDGMILSERELELGLDHSGIVVLPDPWEPGTPLGDVLPLSDEVIEVETTGNRPDLLSIYGVAREVAALLDLSLAAPPGRDPERVGNEPVDVAVDDPVGCPRYIGRLFRNVRVAPSPPWLKARIIAAGMRPISNVVDVTNYVMIALGSPLHAFDRERLAGGRIGVRRAQPDEEIVTLDGTARTLRESDLLITDALRPIAIAGIMGGLESEVGETTTDVILEAANFEPTMILKSSERLRLRTDASNRWEKGVDPYSAEQAAVLATELLVQLSGAQWVGETDVRSALPERPVVTFRPGRASSLIGLDIEPRVQRTTLERLGFEVDETATPWQVTVPTWRARDVTREIDLVEETARFALDDIPFTMPARREMFGRLTDDQRLRRQVEDVMVGAGFSEAYTSSLVSSDPDPKPLRLPEPLTAEQAILRTTLLGGLIEAVQVNVDAGNEEIELFEIARVYEPTGEQLPRERWHVAGITEGGYPRARGAIETLFAAFRLDPTLARVASEWLHPGKAASVGIRGGAVQAVAGSLGELHPSLLEGAWGVFELDLATVFAEIPERTIFEDVVTYPAVRQDLALVVSEELSAGELVEATRELGGRELREVRVFDVYRGGQIPSGKKSIAIRLAFQSPERTLSDEDAQVLRERIVAGLAERFGAELRA